MSDRLVYIAEQFKGHFITAPAEMARKLKDIKAYVFDWDGVFNSGLKDAGGSSPFSEVDSMGTNLLRFHHSLVHHELPSVAIISGENNQAARYLAQREAFHAVYSGMKFKNEALLHFCKEQNLKPHQIAFFFDDVLDLSVAQQVGVRIMVSRAANPLLLDFAVAGNMADYLTGCEGGRGAVREGVELLMGLSGDYHETVTHRMNFTETYQSYLAKRNAVASNFFISENSVITQQSHS